MMEAIAETVKEISSLLDGSTGSRVLQTVLLVPTKKNGSALYVANFRLSLEPGEIPTLVATLIEEPSPQYPDEVAEEPIGVPDLERAPELLVAPALRAVKRQRPGLLVHYRGCVGYQRE